MLGFKTLFGSKSAPVTVPEAPKSLLHNATLAITKGAEATVSGAQNFGSAVLNGIKENPVTSMAGAGLAALVAGIAIGRVSSKDDDDDDTKSHH